MAAWCEPGRRDVRVLSNSLGENLTPSAVSVKRPRRSGEVPEILVGRAALKYGPSAPTDTILLIKRLMGRNFAEAQIQDVAVRFHYEIVPGPVDPRAHVRLNGTIQTPAEISALILGCLNRMPSVIEASRIEVSGCHGLPYPTLGRQFRNLGQMCIKLSRGIRPCPAAFGLSRSAAASYRNMVEADLTKPTRHGCIAG